MSILAAMTALKNQDYKNFFVAATDGGIENQEAEGQQDFCNKSQLPIDGTMRNKDKWEALGFKFGEMVDDIFVSVDMPQGWRFSATEHSMHNDLLDDKGRKRASVFYKAAFYDRNAHVSLVCRFGLGYRPVGGWADYSDVRNGWEAYVYDNSCDSNAFVTQPTLGESRDAERKVYNEKVETQRRERVEEAQAWLDSRYPDYKNPLAYWD